MPVPGADLDGVHYLRTFDDSDALRAAIEGGGRLVVIGAGWIGCEVAASARQKGLDVTLSSRRTLPLERVLGAGARRDLPRRPPRPRRRAAARRRRRGDRGRRRASSACGSPAARAIDCDLVVVGIGVAPRTQLAEAAGLARRQRHPRRRPPAHERARRLRRRRRRQRRPPALRQRVRVEHWANALEQGPAAARNMLGQRRPLRQGPVLLLRPVRRRHGVRRPRRGWTTASCSAATWPAREFIAFWLRAAASRRA